jgi:hypothetical protein
LFALKLEERLKFNEGDIGLAGGIQALEPSNATPINVDAIRRSGGSASADMPRKDSSNDEGDNFERLEKVVQSRLVSIQIGLNSDWVPPVPVQAYHHCGFPLSQCRLPSLQFPPVPVQVTNTAVSPVPVQAYLPSLRSSPVPVQATITVVPPVPVQAYHHCGCPLSQCRSPSLRFPLFQCRLTITGLTPGGTYLARVWLGCR